MELRFLNIDLDLVTAAEPSRLLADMGDAVFVLYSGPTDDGHLTSLEIAGDSTTPESTMQEFRRILDQLEAPAKHEWLQARKKEFNFGFETEEAPKQVKFSLSPKVISMLAETGGSFGITVYRNAEITEPPAGSDAEDRAPQP